MKKNRTMLVVLDAAALSVLNGLPHAYHQQEASELKHCIMKTDASV